MYLQLIDLFSILIFMTGLIVYRFWMIKKIKNSLNIYPNPSIYSLRIKKSLIPAQMKNEEFSERFQNTDNIIQTALGRDFSELLHELDELCELGKKIRQMEIDLSPDDHVAKVKKGLFHRP